MKTRRTRRAVNRRVLILAVVRAASSVLLILVVHACVFSSFSLSQREREREYVCFNFVICGVLMMTKEEEDFGCLESGLVKKENPRRRARKARI